MKKITKTAKEVQNPQYSMSTVLIIRLPVGHKCQREMVSLFELVIKLVTLDDFYSWE